MCVVDFAVTNHHRRHHQHTISYHRYRHCDAHSVRTPIRVHRRHRAPHPCTSASMRECATDTTIVLVRTALWRHGTNTHQNIAVSLPWSSEVCVCVWRHRRTRTGVDAAPRLWGVRPQSSSVGRAYGHPKGGTCRSLTTFSGCVGAVLPERGAFAVRSKNGSL